IWSLSAFEPAETPANCGLFLRDRETRFASDCVVPPRSPMRTDVFRFLTKSAHFAGIVARFNAGRPVSAAGRGCNSLDFGSRSLASPNPFMAPAGVAHEIAGIKSTTRTSRTGETIRQEHRATPSRALSGEVESGIPNCA